MLIALRLWVTGKQIDSSTINFSSLSELVFRAGLGSIKFIKGFLFEPVIL